MDKIGPPAPEEHFHPIFEGGGSPHINRRRKKTEKQKRVSKAGNVKEHRARGVSSARKVESVG